MSDKNPTLRELFADFPARLQFADPVVVRALKSVFSVDVDESSLILDSDDEFPDRCCQVIKVGAMFKDLEETPHFGHIIFSVSMEDGLLTLQVGAESASTQQVGETIH